MLDDAGRRAILAGLRNGLSRQDAAERAGITAVALDRETAADSRFARHCDAAADPALRGGRWSCPGWHCGSFTGYQYGCREPECAASVPAEKQRKRDRGGKTSRAPFGPEQRARFLRLVAAGRPMTVAAAELGLDPQRVRAARRTEAGFEAALRAAMTEAGRHLRPLREPDCPGADCGTEAGYHTFRCRAGQCIAGRMTRSAGREGREGDAGRAAARRFGAADAERYIALVAAGLTVNEAARQAGWHMTTVYYARKRDAAFDTRVVAASEAARTPGSPGDRVRRVSRE